MNEEDEKVRLRIVAVSFGIAQRGDVLKLASLPSLQNQTHVCAPAFLRATGRP